MAEIRAVVPNGLRVASTFSGAGGSCLGFKWAGYQHVYASEFVPAARETYVANFPDVRLDPRDIREVQPGDLTSDCGDRGLDVLEGSPPCASFSTAGKRHKAWGTSKQYSDTKQRSDDLFFEFIRLVDGARPAAFVAENVSGLIKGVAKGYFKEILARMIGCGYRVECALLDAQWLGVPQMRQRVIFVGVREDLGRDPVFPDPLPYRYSVRDALPWVDAVKFDQSGQYRVKEVDVPRESSPTVTVGAFAGNASGSLKVRSSGFRGNDPAVNPDRPAPTVMAVGMGGDAAHQIGVCGPSIEGTAIGLEYANLRPGEASDKYFNLVRPDPDRPLPTVTQAGGGRGVASVVHPNEPRKFTIVELRRLCGFPDDFALTGKYAQQWERLGRAVPPPMMYHVAKTLADRVLLPWRTGG